MGWANVCGSPTVDKPDSTRVRRNTDSVTTVISSPSHCSSYETHGSEPHSPRLWKPKPGADLPPCLPMPNNNIHFTNSGWTLNGHTVVSDTKEDFSKHSHHYFYYDPHCLLDYWPKFLSSFFLELLDRKCNFTRHSSMLINITAFSN